MSWGLTLGLGIALVAYLIGFMVGVWQTHDWIESVAPGTSKQILELEARQKRNRRK